MSNVLLIILIIIGVIMTGLILIQQSEGGALGIGGGGGGGGGFMSGRSAANSVSRMTWILGVIFFVICMLLTVVFNSENEESSILDEIDAVPALTIDSDSGDTVDPLAGVSLPTDIDTDAVVSPEQSLNETQAQPVEVEPEDAPAQPQGSDDE